MSAPPPLDFVTDLQERVGRLDAMLFNYLGALQRDAPPQPLKEEPLVAAPKTYDVQVSGGEGGSIFRWRRRRLPHCTTTRPLAALRSTPTYPN